LTGAPEVPRSDIVRVTGCTFRDGCVSHSVRRMATPAYLEIFHHPQLIIFPSRPARRVYTLLNNRTVNWYVM